jgi:hypothetical protein
MSGGSGSEKDAKTEREKRLAEALRANLRRRKAQQRNRSARVAESDRDEDERH